MMLLWAFAETQITHDNYKIQIVASAGTDNIAIWCISDDMIT